jgi:hypothetical protein
MRYWLLFAAIMLAVIPTPAQTHQPYIAFRVDDERVIANLLTTEQTPPQIREGLSEPPVARYGYEYFDVPEWWNNDDVPDITPGDRWFLQIAPGRVVPATVERLVGGYMGCDPAIGVLLTLARADLKASRARYFLATTTPPPSPATPQPVRTLPAASQSPQLRESIDQVLQELMVRQLPGVREKAAPFFLRALDGQVPRDRTWARQWLRIEDEMQAGRNTLRYDVQAFQLSPDKVPIYFIRAEWMVGNRQGFAATMWGRGRQQMEVLETNAGPASRMRMSLFPRVYPAHMGFILNVFDSDGDGWGEVLFAVDGYESKTVTLLEYSPTGFTKTGVKFAGGC